MATRDGYEPVMLLLANIVRGIAGLVAGVIAVGVLLVVVDANEDNTIVDAVLEVARFFTDPFRSIVDLENGKEHLQIAINFGIAAAAYLAVGFAIAALLRALAVRAAR